MSFLVFSHCGGLVWQVNNCIWGVMRSSLSSLISLSVFSINIVSQVTSVHSITGVHWSWSRYWSLTLWDSRAWGLCPWLRWRGTWPGYPPCSGATLARGDNTVQAAQVGSTSLYRINNQIWFNFFYSWEYVMFLSQLPGHPLHQEWFIQTKIQVWIFSTQRFISGFITNTKIIQEDISQQLLWYSGHLYSQHSKWGLYHLPAKFLYTDTDASFLFFSSRSLKITFLRQWTLQEIKWLQRVRWMRFWWSLEFSKKKGKISCFRFPYSNFHSMEI